MIEKEDYINICKQLKADYVSHEFLSRGAHNETFLLNTSKTKYVIKIENNPMYKNIKQEYDVLKMLKGEFGPKVYLYDKLNNREFIVMEFIEGKNPSRKANREFIIKMANWYKQLHKYKKVLNLKEKNKLNIVNKYKQNRKTINNFKSEVPSNCWNKYHKILCDLDELIIQIDPLHKYSLVQGDPTRSNVFINKSKIKLIDWEFSRYDYPETDITFFEYSYDLNKNLKNLFLETYGYKNKKTLNLFRIDLYLGLITWRFERLNHLSKGKLKLEMKCTDRDILLKEMDEDFKEIENLMHS